MSLPSDPRRPPPQGANPQRDTWRRSLQTAGQGGAPLKTMSDSLWRRPYPGAINSYPQNPMASPPPADRGQRETFLARNPQLNTYFEQRAAPTNPLLERNSSGYYAGQPGAPGEPFNGAFVMAALRNIGLGVQRTGATAREFGIGQGVGPETGTPAARAFELGGATPTQPAEPYFRRPTWWPR